MDKRLARAEGDISRVTESITYSKVIRRLH